MGLTNRAVGDAVPLAGTIYKIYDSVSDTGSCPQCGGDLSPRYEVASVRALEPSRHHIPFLLLPDTSKDFYPTPYIHSFLDVEGALIDEEDSTVVLPRSQQLVEKDRERVKHIGQKKTIEPIITPEPKSVPVPPVNIPVKPLSAIPVPLQASTYVWDICDTRCPRCKTLILFPREHDSGQVPFGGNAWSFMFSYYLSMRLHSTQFCTQHDDWIRCSKCRLHLSREYIQSRTPIIRIFGTSDYEQTNILSGYCGMEINHAHPFWRTVAQFADMRLARCPHCAKYFTHVNMEHTKFKQVESMQGGHSTISGFMSELAGTDPNHVPFAWFQKNRLTACPNCSKPILHPNELEGRPYWGIAYKTQ